MKVYVKPPKVDSRAPQRVEQALIDYAPPGLEFTHKFGSAELIVLHVFGRQDATTRAVRQIMDSGRRYAIIQYCVRSTLRPSTEGWWPLWKYADLVWSYLDLPELCREDGMVSGGFEFYHAPLGADHAIFRPGSLQQRRFVIATSGRTAVTEGIREAIHAARRVNRMVFHLGPQLRRGPGVVCVGDIDDRTLAYYYRQCDYVAGLRRTEGFELPAAEGLLCGARPICFDRAHYRKWYEPWAVFIPEGSRDGVIDNLERVFRQRYEPPAEEEIEAARELFDWRRIIGDFWERVLGHQD